MFCEHRGSKFIFVFAAKVVSSNPADGEVYSIQLYGINIVSDFRQVGKCKYISIIMMLAFGHCTTPYVSNIVTFYFDLNDLSNVS
jgi:hypothetical protein